uniref:uncharacterized protein LOC120328378 isoform X1 n=1 Tax=Styela clava TaxID=7725 RepID=UPI001939EB6C|nr:uncharacterized protein LOC120328378 isoform X1 [Styela clava]
MGVKFVLVIVVLAVLVFNEADAWSRLKRWGKKLTGGGQHNPAEVETGNEESHYHQPQQQSYYSSRRRRRSRSSYSRRRRSRRGDIEIAEQENEEESESTNNLPDYNENRQILSDMLEFIIDDATNHLFEDEEQVASHTI